MARPKYKPTDRERGLVEAHIACGTPEPEIARILRIDPKTLRLYYAVEIATARHSANAEVAGTLFKMATGKAKTSDGKQAAPNVIAAIFWLKTRGGWREKDRTGDGDEAPDGQLPSEVNIDGTKLNLKNLNVEQLRELKGLLEASMKRPKKPGS